MTQVNSTEASAATTLTSRWRKLAETPMPPSALPGTLLLCLVAWGVISWLPASDSLRASSSTAIHRSTTLPNAGDLLELRIADLAAPTSTMRPGRNIFDHGDAATVESMPKRGEDRAKDRELVGDDTRQAPPKEPSLDVALLGVFGPARLRIAVLEHLDGSGISNVLEQDIVQGAYKVEKIDLKSVHFNKAGTWTNRRSVSISTRGLENADYSEDPWVIHAE